MSCTPHVTALLEVPELYQPSITRRLLTEGVLETYCHISPTSINTNRQRELAYLGCQTHLCSLFSLYLRFSMNMPLFYSVVAYAWPFDVVVQSIDG
jgi:hypothetical protein